ncbi:MAG: hypothetical protein LBS52_01135 [Dysgonamonadaceae bacterium]|jgi:hypothetical protein|nr:hypothetical protein [Dysgonamonadaceae bacterium]
MKKLIVSTAMLFALSFTAGVMAQDVKPNKDAGKAKTECCSKKDKKEGCCADKAEKKDGEKKSCCSEKKVAEKKSGEKKSGEKK